MVATGQAELKSAEYYKVIVHWVALSTSIRHDQAMTIKQFTFQGRGALTDSCKGLAAA